MADRTSAEIFSNVFELIVKYVPDSPERDEMALLFWNLSRGYDFSDNQMDCDEALRELGLARYGIDPDWPEDGEVLLYGPPPSSV